MSRAGALAAACAALAASAGATPAAAAVPDARAQAAGATPVASGASVARASRPARSGTVAVTPAQARALAARGLDVGEGLARGRLPVVLHDRADRRAVRGLDFRAAPRGTRQATGALPSGRTAYRDLADYERELAELAAAHPRRARLVPIGTSVQGRPIVGIEIATGVNRRDDGRPLHVQVGLHHAREWNSGEVVLEYAYDLLRGYGADDRVTRIVDRTRTFLVPVMNPDGLQISRSSTPLLRKNAAGVDLNRNYGAFWGGAGASDLPASDLYRGPAPFSEPESRALRDYSAAHQVVVMNAIHSFGGLVLYQPGFTRTDEPGLPAGAALPYRDAFEGLARAMADAAGYTAQPAYALYDATGATEDWNYFAQGALGFTTEIGSADFQSPYADGVVNQYAGGLREAFLRAGEATREPATHGVLRGIAPPGATLTLRKDVALTTANVRSGTDTPLPATGAAQDQSTALTSELVVPPSGEFAWHVNPSTPPLVALAGLTQPLALSCGPTSRAVVVGMGEARRADLQCLATTRLRVVSVERRGRRSVVRVRARGTPVRALTARAGGRRVTRRVVSGTARLVVPGRERVRVAARAPDGRRVTATGR